MGALYTLSQECGGFSILSGENEIIIIDPNLHLEAKDGGDSLIKVIGELGKGKTLCGLIVSNLRGNDIEFKGVSLILKFLNPFWIAFPKCEKEEKLAKKFFEAVSEAEFEKNKVFKRIPVSANRLSIYPSLERISRDFSFLPFSPFMAEKEREDEELVLKITEKTTKRSILISGDASKEHFLKIRQIYGKKIKSDILLSYPNFFSSGIPEETFDLINPQAVLICAGRGSNLNLEAMSVFEKAFCFSTDESSLAAIFDSKDIKTIRIKGFSPFS